MNDIFVNLFDDNQSSSGESCYGSCNCNCNTCNSCNTCYQCYSCHDCYTECGSNSYC